MLLPMLGLGVILNSTYKNDAQNRTLSDAISRGQLLAMTAVAPSVASQDLGRGLDVAAMADLGAAIDSASRQGKLLRVRLFSMRELVVFPPPAAGEVISVRVASVVAGVLDGRPVAEEINQSQGPGRAAVHVVHVFVPVFTPTDQRRLGVLELYLPYEQVAQSVQKQTRELNFVLLIGLVAVYLMIAGLSWVVTAALRRQSAANAHLANHDALTGLPNRGLFRANAVRAIAAAGRGNGSCAVVLVDLDRFKQVNDTLGHHAGDRLLCAVADRLSVVLRSQDTVARLGGDEFGLILPGAGREIAEPLLRVARQAIAEDLDLEGVTLSVSASFGLAMFPDDGSEINVLLQRADVAMYVAKSGGRGVASFSSQMAAADAAELGLVADLRHALIDGGLLLHYQPQVCLSDGTLECVEALVRWQHPVRGLLEPEGFIPVAEQTDLIDALTRWVLLGALEQIHQWSQAGHAVDVAVNISARTLQDQQFPTLVAHLLSQVGVAASRLHLELTETVLIQDFEATRMVMQELADLGVQLSIDDFGAGFTSMTALRVLPVSQVKIDKSYVTSMRENPKDAAIVGALVRLGHSLGMRVVGEGVQDAATLHALRDLGCDAAQGFHLGAAVSAEQVQVRLQRSDTGPPVAQVAT